MISWNRIYKPPREWSLVKNMTPISWRTAILACLGAMVFGYDTAWWSGVLGMPAFTSRYGTFNPVTKKYAISSPLTSSGSGIPTAGRIIGSIITPLIADRIGRRWTMLGNEHYVHCVHHCRGYGEVVLANCQREQALTVMKTLRKDDGTAEQEIADIEASLEKRIEAGSWLDLVRGSNLRRTIISITIPTVEAWQGQSFMGNYLVVFLISLGAKNQYLLSTMLQMVLLVTVTLTFWMSDHIGRRPLLLFGSATMWITFFITSGVSGHDSTQTSDSRKQVAVGMLFIWAIAYACTYQTVGYLAPAETPTTRLRSKTSGVAYFFQQCGGLIVTFVAPYMQDPKYEMKGLSVEELDVLFDQRLSTRRFSKVPRGTRTLAGGVIEGQEMASSVSSDEEKGNEGKDGAGVTVTGTRVVGGTEI
ncbi:hypothetical protein BDV96DRAFT_599300 [Lophiotrema nucula]|uniref:General substrate transporter n=1 Tax=Lophiotrema nucula TaxID=690887 RepID=A0A6A5Z889_9PLEO|nr:hypothetical protein BDV96DRAFT_599300 [Lophiotrema nucula]